MSSIPQNHSDEKALIDCVQRFFSKHHVGKLLARCNGMKEKGVSPVSLFRYKLSNIFVGRSMYMQQQTGSFKEAFSKNTFYRFLNSTKTNWLRFTSLLAADIVNHDIKGLTNDSRKNVFIIDDSLFNRTSCKKTELGSKVFDHTDMRFKKGFRMLTLSWSDGNTLIPVNSCLLASAKDTNIIGPVKNFDNRTLAGKRRKLARTKAPEAMLNLIGECHSLSYDALTAHVAIVFTRYMLFAMEQRQNEDQRTLGELFFLLVDEMTDITFNRSLGILMAALMASLQEILKLSDEQLTAFTADFEARLPEYLRNALHPEIAMA